MRESCRAKTCGDPDCAECNPDSDDSDESEAPVKRTNKDNLPPTRRACGNCGLLGHLATTCQGPGKAHAKIGVEIEGYWDRARWGEVEAIADRWHMSGTEDGSLNVHADMKSYEWRTRPGSLGEAISQLLAVYPDGTDSAVGMHVHLSFNETADIMALASDEFFAYFREQWIAWGNELNVDNGSEFWKRLNGQNNYCKPVTLETAFNRRGRCPGGYVWCNGDHGGSDYCSSSACRRAWEARGRRPQPVTNAPEVTCMLDRYYQLNFTSYSRHGTVECRMLPMFRNARLGVLALEKLVSIFESFLQRAEETVYTPANRSVRFNPAKLAAAGGVTVARVDLPSPVSEVSDVGTLLYGIPTNDEQDSAGVAVMARTAVRQYLTNEGVL